MAKRDEVIAALRARSARGAALNYAAVVADDEALTGRARRIFGDWNAALIAAGFDPAEIRHPRDGFLPPGTWSAPLVIEGVLERAARGLSLAPHRVQIDDSKLYSAAVGYIGSWREAVALAGLESQQLERQWDEAAVLDRLSALDAAGADLSVRTVEAFDSGLYAAAVRLFGTWDAAIAAAGATAQRRTTRWTRAAVLAAIELGAKGQTTTSGLYQAAIRHFGTWDQAVRAATGNNGELVIGLRDARKAARLSQAELGRRVGRSHRWVGLIEVGAITPDLAMALRLARELGVAVEALFQLSGG